LKLLKKVSCHGPTSPPPSPGRVKGRNLAGRDQPIGQIRCNLAGIYFSGRRNDEFLWGEVSENIRSEKGIKWPGLDFFIGGKERIFRSLA